MRFFSTVGETHIEVNERDCGKKSSREEREGVVPLGSEGVRMLQTGENGSTGIDTRGHLREKVHSDREEEHEASITMRSSSQRPPIRCATNVARRR